MVLNKETLLETFGGAKTNSWGLGIIFAALGTMIIGIIDGFMRPLSCNK